MPTEWLEFAPSLPTPGDVLGAFARPPRVAALVAGRVAAARARHREAQAAQRRERGPEGEAVAALPDHVAVVQLACAGWSAPWSVTAVENRFEAYFVV